MRRVKAHYCCSAVFACMLSIAGISFPQVATVPAMPNVRTLLISVRSKEESLELATADFEIKENGQPVQIQKVQKVERLPLRYCRLFDVSGSERSRFKFQQQTATLVIESVARPKIDSGWITLFSTRAAKAMKWMILRSFCPR